MADGSGSFSGDQVSEELSHDGDAFDADPVDGGLGMSGQRAADTADVVVGLPGQEARVTVATLPELRRGERQRTGRTATRSCSVGTRCR